MQYNSYPYHDEKSRQNKLADQYSIGYYRCSEKNDNLMPIKDGEQTPTFDHLKVTTPKCVC